MFDGSTCLMKDTFGFGFGHGGVELNPVEEVGTRATEGGHFNVIVFVVFEEGDQLADVAVGPVTEEGEDVDFEGNCAEVTVSCPCVDKYSGFSDVFHDSRLYY